MVQHFLHGQALAARPARRGVAGVGVAGQRLGADVEERGEEGGVLRLLDDGDVARRDVDRGVGLAGLMIAPNPALATIPISLIVFGSMTTALWLSPLMQHFGRRAGFFIGAAGGATGAAVSAWGLWTDSFALFLVGAYEHLSDISDRLLRALPPVLSLSRDDWKSPLVDMLCDEVIKDPETGEVVELRCSHDPDTMGANPADGRRIKGTVHWVSARHALRAEVRLYDRLFSVADPDEGLDEGEDFTKNLNPDSLVVVNPAWVEPSLSADPPGSRYQFERQGYFVSDPVDSEPGALVFNRTVTLRDRWAKLSAKG